MNAKGTTHIPLRFIELAHESFTVPLLRKPIFVHCPFNAKKLVVKDACYERAN
jgi:hypothetical protein